MVTTLTCGSTATRAEVFTVPDDYPSVECDGGLLLAPGVYWWILGGDGVPEGYPVGPFGSKIEAMVDWDAQGSYEPVEE